MRLRLLLMSITTSVLFLGPIHGYSQIITPRILKDVRPYRYKIGQNDVNEEEKSIFLTISIGGGVYEEARLRSTVLKLRCQNPRFAKVNIIILESLSAARHISASPVDNPRYGKGHASVRGFYSFDLGSQQEFLEFSTEKKQDMKKYPFVFRPDGCE